MKVFTGLNESGRIAMREFLITNIKDASLLTQQAAFELDIDLDSDPGHFELSGRFTVDGNPVTTRFKESELDSTEVEE